MPKLAGSSSNRPSHGTEAANRELLFLRTKRLVIGVFCISIACILLSILSGFVGWGTLAGITSAIGILLWVLVPIYLVFQLVRSLAHAMFGNKNDTGTPSDSSAAVTHDNARTDLELTSMVSEIEAFRARNARSLKLCTIAIFAVIGVTGLLITLFKANSPAEYAGGLIATAIVAVGCYLPISERFRKTYRSEFKRLLMKKLLARHGALMPAPEFRPDLSRPVAFGMIPDHQTVAMDDCFAGMHAGHRIEIMEMTVSIPKPANYKRGMNGKFPPLSWNVLMVQIHLTHPLTATTLVRSTDTMEKKNLSRERSLEPVRLEDTVFDTVYSVRSGDQVGARALLTPAVMTCMLEMANDSQFRPPELLADGDRLFFFPRLTAQKNLFEPPGLDDENILRHVAAVDADLKVVIGLVDVMADIADALPASQTLSDISTALSARRPK